MNDFSHGQVMKASVTHLYTNFPLVPPPPPPLSKEVADCTGKEGSEELFTVVNISTVIIIIIIIKTLLMCQMPSLHRV